MQTDKPKADKPKNEKPQMTVRLAPSTLAALRQIAAADHLSISAHVQLALNDYLAKHSLPPLPPPDPR